MSRGGEYPQNKEKEGIIGPPKSIRSAMTLRGMCFGRLGRAYSGISASAQTQGLRPCEGWRRTTTKKNEHVGGA